MLMLSRQKSSNLYATGAQTIMTNMHFIGGVGKFVVI